MPTFTFLETAYFAMCEIRKLLYKFIQLFAAISANADVNPSIGMAFVISNTVRGRFQWPLDLRSGSAAARLLALWVRIPLGAWMFVCCDCCVLSGRGFCVGLITRPEESYRV